MGPVRIGDNVAQIVNLRAQANSLRYKGVAISTVRLS
jgi:hypothetical protein